MPRAGTAFTCTAATVVAGEIAAVSAPSDYRDIPYLVTMPRAGAAFRWGGANTTSRKNAGNATASGELNRAGWN